MAASKAAAESVKVIVRCRPLNSKEKEHRFERIVDMEVPRGLIELRNPKAPDEVPKQFTFDSIYDWNSRQRDLYDETFRGLVNSSIEGFNATIFAYGQTGTGKTHTMQGVRNDPDLRGVIPNSFEHIFSHIQSSQNEQYLVRAAYLEIYQEEIRDLLHKDQNKRLELKERPDSGIYVKDLSSCVCKDIQELERVMNVGDSNRVVGATNMNEHSSRSHAILIVTIDSSAEIGQDGKQHTRVGKLNLVDLAGSERQTKTGAEGERLKEATKINLSLSALGNVISALVDGKSTHVPYRDSKLTRLLQDSLGGNAKTVMVANIGPADYNYDETMSTLRYANRAKNIKNRPKINEDPKDGLLRQFQEEIARLRDMLSQKGGPSVMGGKRRKKQRMDENGEPIEGEEDDDGDVDDDDPEAVEQYMNERRRELESERDAIIGNKSLITEEKQRLLSELKSREEQIERERNAQLELAEQVRVMESKVLGGLGGRSIEAHTRDQDRQLAERRRELAEKQESTKRIQSAVDEQETALLTVQTNYRSLQDEVNDRTKKLKALYKKLQQVKQEVIDLQEEQRREREDFESTQNELTKELKKRQMIIENFVPPDERERLLMRLVYEEESENWNLRNLSDAITHDDMMKRPKSASGNRRPTTEYAKRNAHQQNLARFKGENILLVELDLPNRTTRDYEGPQVAPRVQAALDAALNDDQPIEIDCANSFSTDRSAKSAKRGGTTSRANVAAAAVLAANRITDTQFPTSRGLVSRR